MKIGYYVQADLDEAIVRGLAARWCPEAEFGRREISREFACLLQAGDSQVPVGIEGCEGVRCYGDVRRLAQWTGCPFPNELGN